MSPVIKKKKKHSATDLISALTKFITLLESQKEDDAVRDLKVIISDLQKFQPDSDEFSTAIDSIFDAFEGEHELSAYTLRRQKADDDWTIAEDLYLASIDVLNLAKRFVKDED